MLLLSTQHEEKQEGTNIRACRKDSRALKRMERGRRKKNPEQIFTGEGRKYGKA